MVRTKNLAGVSNPITSPEESERLKEERKQRNRLNRQRAKNMERRVARYLGGDRTPQSGAGNSKGDVAVLFTNRPGRYLVECKLTDQWFNGHPAMSLSKAWLLKIQEEARQMNALFGILVFRFHQRQDDYVLVRASDMAKLIKMGDTPLSLAFETSAKTIHMTFERAQLCKQPPGFVSVSINYVIYYLMTMSRYKQLLDES